MIHQFKNRHFYFVLGVDIALFALSLLLAYFIRFSFAIPGDEWQRIEWLLPLSLTVKTLIFTMMGAYRGMWRYTSIPDTWRLTKASVLSTMIVMAGLTIANHFEGYPRSVFLADCIFTLFFCGGFRIGIRMMSTHRRFFQQFFGNSNGSETDTARSIRLLIIGAGDSAATIIREIKNNNRSPYHVVFCVDDDVHKHGLTLLGVPAGGPITRLSHFVRRYQADEILIAMPSVEGATMRQIVGICKSTGLPFKTLPSLSSLVDGCVTVNDVREVKYEDLLGRPPVRLDSAGIGKYLAGKTVAVTGAGGSIGSELCRQIIRFKPASLVLIDASEYNLYHIEKELRIDNKFDAVHPAMGRVQDHPLMAHIFNTFRPQVVFHAAACKHVPMVEANPWEGVFNNVIGSSVIMDVAQEFGVERFVQVSTDKAVRPTSVMGASKRVAELLLQNRVPGKTRFMAVRFGNVLGSSGSVIPLFVQQIKAGGPVTVTHPEMTRYFMMIPEACQLTLQAGCMGEGGEIYILEMGTPIKIADMARDIIKLSGKIPDKDIEILYTGLRPGEKLYEELITHGEGIVATPHEKIMVLRCSSNGLDPVVREKQVRDNLAKLATAATTFDGAHIKMVIQQIIPEYTPSL